MKILNKVIVIKLTMHNWLKGDSKQVSLPHASLFWNGGIYTFCLVLFFIEAQIWFGKPNEIEEVKSDATIKFTV